MLGLDKDGQPEYGLIFGAFMACGVLGGFAEPTVRKAITRFTKTDEKTEVESSHDASIIGEEDLKPVAVDFLCTMCYLTSALLFLIPCMLQNDSPYSFSICFASFLAYELMVGLYMPCEGVIRSIYMPNESICSLMTMLRVIVNVAVALGVISTNYIPFARAFLALSVMMVVAAILQISLVPKKELTRLFISFGKSRFAKEKVA